MALSQEDQLQLRNFGILTGIAIAVLVFAPLTDYGIGIGILKIRQNIQTYQKQIITAGEEYNKKKNMIDRIPALEAELAEREPDIRKFEARLPKDKKVPDLFRDIDHFQQISGFDILVQTRLEPVEKGDYVELPIRIEGKGDFDSIATFINQLERNQRFAQVKEVRVTEKPGEGNEDKKTPDFIRHDVVMTISTFMFNDLMVRAEKEESASNAKKTQ